MQVFERGHAEPELPFCELSDEAWAADPIDLAFEEVLPSREGESLSTECLEVGGIGPDRVPNARTVREAVDQELKCELSDVVGCARRGAFPSRTYRARRWARSRCPATTGTA